MPICSSKPSTVRRGRHRHHPGVVDQQVQRPVRPPLGERPDRGQVGQVERAALDRRVRAPRPAPGVRRRRPCPRPARSAPPCAPWAASASAVSRPRPELAPVTTARRPVRSGMSLSGPARGSTWRFTCRRHAPHGGGRRRNRVDAPVRRAERRPRVGLAADRPERHRPLGLRGDGQRRVGAEVGRHRGAVDDVQAGVAEHPVPAVDHAVGRRRRRSGQPPRKCAVSVEPSRSAAFPPGSPSMTCASRRTTSLPAGIQVGLGVAVPRPAGQRPPAEPAAAGDDQRVVDRLHDQPDDRPLRPAADRERAQERDRVPQLVGQPGEPPRPRPVAVGERDRQQTHRVRAAAVAHRLDVGVRRRPERRRDRDAAGEVDVAPPRQRAHQRLRVGAGQLAEPRRQVRQPAGVAHPVQQPLGPPGAGGEHHLRGRDRLAGPAAGTTRRSARSRPATRRAPRAGRTRS